MKKKLQLILSFLMFSLILIGFTLFIYVTYQYLFNELSKQTMKNNQLLGEKIADLLIGEEINKLNDMDKMNKLQQICDQIELPDGGYACATGMEGNLIAMTGGLPEDRTIDFASFKIKDKNGNDIGVVKDLPKDAPFQGFFEREDNGQDIIASVAVEKDEVKIFVHQDEEIIQKKISVMTKPLLFLGLIISIVLGIFTFLTTDFIILRYESKIEKINKDLEKSNINLAQVSQKRSQLVHVLSHDLANPLTSIQSATEMIDFKPDKCVHYSDLIKRATKQSIGIINVVRKMEALESGKFELNLKKTNLRKIINNSYLTLKNKFDAKDISLKLDIETECEVLAEPISLQSSVINNILTNAIKFSPKGGEIYIKSQKEDEKVLLSIRDYGIGMPEELVKKVFDINTKTNRKGTEGESGTGFGMPLMKQFVEAYGGNLSIKSKEKNQENDDHGTEIIILFRV